MTYLWNAHDCVPFCVNCVLRVKFDGGVVVAGQGPSISQPLAAGCRLASEPDVVPDRATLLKCQVEDSISDDVRWYCKSEMKF